MSSLTLYYDWADINQDLNLMAQSIDAEPHDYDIIIAINNDLVPATLMASRLDLPVTQVKYGDISGVFHGPDNIPFICNPIESGSGKLPGYPKLLIVVSYFNSDKEVQHVADFYKSCGHHTHLIAIFNSARQHFGEQIVGYQNFVHSGTKITFPWKL